MDKILDITQQVEALGKTAEHLATGLLAVDKLCGGLPRGGVTLVGGRPGMGCTSFALSIMHQIAQRQAGNILIFAPQIRSHQLCARMLEISMGASLEDVFRGKLSKDLLTHAAQAYKANIRIDNDSYPTLENILQHTISTPQLQLLVIDGLERVCRPVNFETEDICFSQEQDTFENILRCLKGIAKSRNIPVLCTHHLPRSLEKRKNKRPKLTDLDKKGLPESLADQIIFLYRDRYYEFDGEEGAECIVAKSPGGVTGTVILGWDHQVGKFLNL
ncbi:MAG: DnaB-like helicase C-terminal domain-containing protein [Oscillospiraceae bacterium]|nr:DnaB-like helicase C-terminal domain-containing protein [Oscillospiraceae bacterium]